MPGRARSSQYSRFAQGTCVPIRPRTGFELIVSRLIPISIVRILRLSQALRSDDYNFDYVSVEVLTQAEMCYNILSATLPSLSMFLASVQTGLLELGGTDRMASTYGSASRRNGTPRATLRSGNGKDKNIGSSRGGGVDAFELTEHGHGRQGAEEFACERRFRESYH